MRAHSFAVLCVAFFLLDPMNILVLRFLFGVLLLG